MAELKLAQLPDRAPVKLSLSLMPDLHERLIGYAALYEETYGREEALTELIPAMLASFMDGDRTFMRRKAKP